MLLKKKKNRFIVLSTRREPYGKFATLKLGEVIDVKYCNFSSSNDCNELLYEYLAYNLHWKLITFPAMNNCLCKKY